MITYDIPDIFFPPTPLVFVNVIDIINIAKNIHIIYQYKLDVIRNEASSSLPETWANILLL